MSAKGVIGSVTNLTGHEVIRMISGIILAAGESKRMGKPKQLLPWGKSTILQQVVDNATKSKLGKVLVVLGYRADEIAAKLGQTSAQIVVNQDFKLGMSSSLKCGLRCAPTDSEAFMSLLGDEPLVDTDIIDLLIDRYHTGRYGIIIPVYNGRGGHPVIFDRRYKDELLALGSEDGASEVVHRHPEDVLKVMVDSENILLDIDTVQDYAQARRIDNRHGRHL